MAAGRVDVRRRIDVEKLSRGHVHANPVKNGYNCPSNRKNSASLHKSKFELCPRRCGLDDAVKVKNDVTRMLDDGVQQPPQKKRKFSPIVWDLEDKDARVSSKNRNIDTTILSSPPSPGAKATYSKHPYNSLRKKFPAASFTGSAVLSDAGFDLLNRLLTYDPEKRISAGDALNHDWFRELPLPKSKEFFPTFPPKV